MKKSSLITITAVVVVVIVVLAAFVVLVHPSSTTTKPALAPGTAFVSPTTIGKSMGGTWNRDFSFIIGESNALSLIYAEYGITAPPNSMGYSSTGPIPNLTQNGTAVLKGNAQVSVIGYHESSGTGRLMGLYLYLPNSTIASSLYLYISATIQHNSSVSVKTGTIGTVPFIFGNSTIRGNVTEAIISQDGNYVISFAYMNTAGVPESSLVALMTAELNALGKGVTLAYPSELVSTSQINSALGMDANSSSYVYVNISDMQELMSLSSLTGTGNNQLTHLAIAEKEMINNVTGMGLVAFGDAGMHEMAVSGYITFNTSTYPSTIYQLLTTAMASNSTVAKTLHQGTVDGKQYFYVNISMPVYGFSNMSGPTVVSYYNISIAVSLDGNALLFAIVMSRSVVGYGPLSSVLSSQISDL